METTLAVMERQQQFDFQKNGIEVMNFETLQRTYKKTTSTTTRCKVSTITRSSGA